MTNVTQAECGKIHSSLKKSLLVVVTGLLGILGLVLTLVGMDRMEVSRAAELANKVQQDAASVSQSLEVHRAAVSERDKAVADKLKTFQDQMDKRFDAMIKALDRLGDKLERYNGSAFPESVPIGPVAENRP